MFVRWINDEQGVVDLWTERFLTEQDASWLRGIAARYADIKRIVTDSKEMHVYFQFERPPADRREDELSSAPDPRAYLNWRTRQFLYDLDSFRYP